MTNIKDILATKGSQVLTVGPNATVLDAARLMDEHRIGCLLVMEAGRACGILTERDMLRRVLLCRRDVETTPVQEVMTPAAQLVCCRPHTSIEEARMAMRDRRIRHLPVVEDGDQVCGLISIGDLNALEIHGKEMTIHMLQTYIYGHEPATIDQGGCG